MVELSTDSVGVAAFVAGIVLMILAFQMGFLNTWFGILGFVLVVLLLFAYLFMDDRGG